MVAMATKIPVASHLNACNGSVVLQMECRSGARKDCMAGNYSPNSTQQSLLNFLFSTRKMTAAQEEPYLTQPGFERLTASSDSRGA